MEEKNNFQTNDIVVDENAEPDAANSEDTEPTENAAGTGRTFTQEEVNKIVQKRLAEERNRLKPILEISDEDARNMIAREKEVTKRELVLEARERLIQDGFPEKLIDLLNFDSKGEFEDSYTHITSVFKPIVEAAVQGELNNRLRGVIPQSPNTHTVDPIQGAFRPPQA